MFVPYVTSLQHNRILAFYCFCYYLFLAYVDMTRLVVTRIDQDYIVTDDEIMTKEKIRKDVVTFRSLLFPDIIQCVKWLARRKLVHNIHKCVSCDNMLMSLVKCTSSGDGLRWWCKQCQKYAAIRSNSIFQGSRLPLDQLIKLIYSWATDTPQDTIMRELDVPSNIVNDWCNICNTICEQYFVDNPVILGGLNEDFTPKVVEIQEFKCFESKQWPKGKWMLGGVERESGECFLVPIPDRSKNTLAEVIKRYILPGTLVVSDESNEFSNIGKIDYGIYDHRIISKRNFIDPNDPGIHLQNVKNMSMRVNRKLKHHFGTSEAQSPSYLYEFIWRNKFKKSDIFAEFLICVRQQYQEP